MIIGHRLRCSMSPVSKPDDIQMISRDDLSHLDYLAHKGQQRQQTEVNKELVTGNKLMTEEQMLEQAKLSKVLFDIDGSSEISGLPHQRTRYSLDRQIEWNGKECTRQWMKKVTGFKVSRVWSSDLEARQSWMQ